MSTEYSQGLVVLKARVDAGTDLQTKDILVQVTCSGLIQFW